jgi:hypothetical protein
VIDYSVASGHGIRSDAAGQWHQYQIFHFDPLLSDRRTQGNSSPRPPRTPSDKQAPGSSRHETGNPSLSMSPSTEAQQRVIYRVTIISPCDFFELL